MQFNYKNINVNYTTCGKGSTIVLLHGFLEDLTMWIDISAILSKKHRVINVDLLGHGKTGNLGYVHTMNDQAIMVKALLNHLKLRKYILIGHSMGGYVALSFAKLYQHNIKGLCLMNSSALQDSNEKKINRDRAVKAVKQNKNTFVKIAIPMLLSEQNRTVFTKEINQITKGAIRTSTQGIIAALEGMKIRKDTTDVYKTAMFPIQLIVGKQDPALEYSSLIKQVKNTKVQVVEFPDGHMSYIENKNSLISELLSFIKTC